MTCPSCRADLRSGAKYCPACGAQVSRACAQCGAAAEASDRFCLECGAALDAAPAAKPQIIPLVERGLPAASPVAERRLVSVLFADLVGFTTLSEQRDPEEVRELLTRYFDNARQVITRYGGAVEKFIGDAVMAVWGTPTAREDDADRAVRAALELTATTAALGTEVGALDLQLRAGVVTGEAATTVGAEGQGMVAGDVVNTASRVQSGAPPGTVLVDDATKRSTEAAIAYEDAGLHELKGKAEAVHLWRVSRIVAMARGARRGTVLEGPFVGRDRELRMVKELYHATVEDGRARLVSVVGLAGIGKTRLAWEFEKYLDGIAETVYWHRGRCLSYGEGVTYWALGEMVRRRAEILEAEEPASALAKLRRALETHVADADERRWLEPRLAHLLGLEERTASDRVDLFAAWRLFFERLAETQPTVLVFEEMQWADAGLVDFIDYLLEWSRRHPIYLVTLARPELNERYPSWGSGRRSFHSLYIDPLSPEAMDELLAGLVPGLPADARTRIRDRAEGVPLYAVETVRMLLDRGVLRREGDRFNVTGEVGELDVPETLHALIAARLDALPAEERALLQTAAVLGQSFSKERLNALARIGGSEATALVDSLQRKELLTILADPRSPERGQLAFVQALVQKVAYETLSRHDRKARHLDAARQLESMWAGDADEVVEVVAAHYLEAYRAAPLDSDAAQIRESAHRMLVRAAHRAASLAASQDAERYFAEAAELASESVERAGLLEKAGQMAWRGGRGEDAQVRFEAAIALFEGADHTHPAARVSARLGEVLWGRGDLDAAEKRMEQAFQLLSADTADADVGALAAQLARFQWFRGRIDLAAKSVEVAIDIAESQDQAELLCQALITKAAVLSSRGRRHEAEALIRHALTVALEHDIPSAALRAYANIVDALTKADRHQLAITEATNGVALARRCGDRVWERELIANVLYSLYLAGSWDEAQGRAAELTEIEYTEAWGWGALLLSLVHVQRGRLDEARKTITNSNRAETSADVQTRTIYGGARARLRIAEGRFEEAAADGEASFRAIEEIGPNEGVQEGFVAAGEAALALDDLGRVDALLARLAGQGPGKATRHMRAHALRFQAALAVRRADSDCVESGFRAAENAFRTIGVPFGLAITLTEHAEVLVDGGSAESATELLGEARQIFEHLGAVPWTERVARAEQRCRSSADTRQAPA